MKLAITLTCLACLILPHDAFAASSARKTITCPYLKADDLKFEVPEKPGDLPAVDFDYPSKLTVFSFTKGRLRVVAVDEGEPSRMRIRISARRNAAKGTYDGKITVDMGGNQLMMHKGPVSCRVDG
jgi:hypothetical protein